MFLAMAIIVAISSTFIEAKFVNNSPFMTRLYDQGLGPISGAWMNNLISIFLSFALGFVFQAQGIAIMVGGLLSIPMSNIYFGVKYKLNHRGISMDSLKNEYSSKSGEVEEWVTVNAHYIRDFVKTCWILVKIIGWPLRFILKANSKMLNEKERIEEFQANVRARYEALRT